jgi:hypothetical protein
VSSLVEDRKSDNTRVVHNKGALGDHQRLDLKHDGHMLDPKDFGPTLLDVLWDHTKLYTPPCIPIELLGVQVFQ